MKDYLPQKYHIKIRVYKNQPDFGKGIIEIMDLIKQNGSLSAAYKTLGMSSSKAWKIINKAETDLNVKLIESTIGGKYGGGSRLTDAGEDLLRRYKNFYDDVNKSAEIYFKKYFGE